MIGIVDNFENDSILVDAGYDCLIESIGKCISPRAVSDENFESNLYKLNQLKTNLFAFNIFMPGDLKLVGPNVNEKAILEYVDIILQRVAKTQARMIVWGSGGARRLPDGFDKETAKMQFISIARKVAKKAKKYKIIIALEALNSTETNFINTVDESLFIVKSVNHPNFRLNVDLYHMLKEGEKPNIIAETKKYIGHVEIAEKDGRTAPGVIGTDFRPYLRELAKIKYNKKIVIEGRWKNLTDIAKMSKIFLQNQIDEAYSE
jgi:sugar phosphate isomerase/epimerase